MYPQPPEYPPEYMPGNPWMPRVHNGFRYFLIALVVLTVGGYFTGNPYLVPNIFMSVFSQFQPHSATPPVAHTTDGTTVVSPDDDDTTVNSSPPVPSNQMQSANSANSNAMNANGNPAVSSTAGPEAYSTSAPAVRSSTNGPMTITTTVVPVPHDGSAQMSSTSPTAIINQAPIPAASSPRHVRRVIASLNSDNPTVPDGWYTWPVQKRARYVRALMSRIDAP